MPNAIRIWKGERVVGDIQVGHVIGIDGTGPADVMDVVADDLHVARFDIEGVSTHAAHPVDVEVLYNNIRSVKVPAVFRAIVETIDFGAPPVLRFEGNPA